MMITEHRLQTELPDWNKNKNKGINLRVKDATQTQQQRPELPTVVYIYILTWHVSKYKVHKLNRHT